MEKKKIINRVALLALAFIFCLGFASRASAAVTCTVSRTAPDANGNVTVTGQVNSNLDGGVTSIQIWDNKYTTPVSYSSDSEISSTNYTRNYPTGTYYAYVSGTDGSGTCSKTSPSFTVSASTAPDLTASNLTPTTSIAGTPTTFSVSVNNVGGLSTGATAFYNLFQTSTASDGSANLLSYTSASMSNLAGSASVVSTKDITFPLSAVDTTAYIRVCTDKASSGDSGSIVESNETNNCTGWTPVMITGKSCGGGWGDPEDITGAGVPGSGPVWCSRMPYGFCQPAPSGEKGGHLPSSNGNISICCYGADNYGYVRQCTDPDLQASNIVPTSVVAGTTADFSATITNAGGATTGSTPFTNLFQISSKFDGPSDVTNYVSSSMTGLASNATAVTTKSIPIPISAGASTLYVRVCADKASQSDAYGAIPEGVGENNNCSMWTPINVAPQSNSSDSVTFFGTVPFACPPPPPPPPPVNIPVTAPSCATGPYSATIRWDGNSPSIPALNLSKAERSLIFKTGFEDNTTLSLSQDSSSNYYQAFSGKDNLTGYTWPMTFPGAPVEAISTGIHAITGAYTPKTDYIENRLDSVIGHTGALTNVLTMDIKKAPPVWASEQDVLQIQFDGVSKNIPSELYERYWVKFNPELENQIKTAGNSFWRSFFGFKTGDDYRMEFYIFSDASGNPYWHLQGDNGPSGPITAYYLWQDNKTVPVPLNQWFQVEIYLNRGTPGGTDGRVYMAVNSQTVFDQRGGQFFSDPLLPVQFWGVNNEPIYFIGLSFIYSSIQGPASQMIDDLELYRTYPCANLPCGASGDSTANYFTEISTTDYGIQNAWTSFWNKPVTGQSTQVLNGSGNYAYPVGVGSPVIPTASTMWLKPDVTYYYRLLGSTASGAPAYYFNTGTGGYSFKVPTCTSVPSAPSIDDLGKTAGVSYDFQLKSSDLVGENVKFKIDWDNSGSGIVTTPDAIVASSDGVTNLLQQNVTHTLTSTDPWKTPGTYTFKIQACDNQSPSNCSTWTSHVVTVTPGPSKTVSVSKDVGFGGLITSVVNNDGATKFTCSRSTNPCVTNITSGDNVTLTAAPSSPLWVFAGWSSSDGSCSGMLSTCVLNNITTNKSITAMFALRKPLNYYEY